ncbi:ABC transporter ATP-binding protein [Erwiniaceae bacterium BAC15a-03b]|uniref:ABC transporter ATP-binding protein n=1 Tax=Winslowiella arboricola TaxID=2978220 RepID=A0A9J6PT24_9GAMM|nr:ABC transporter ATP-binding protein [Winslowiella arboricola]MCU5773129.1 ABC transporter ATP-binding protein [Winslowiella arboricola]MCU5778712.1 ABC transporter ATP-binding protein [Winslowiella arboricola]
MTTTEMIYPASNTHVTIRGLYKSFAGQPLYQDLNLDLPKGKIVSIFGPNGCGKSTLMNMVAGLIPLDRGEVLFDGKTLAETTIGYVFQNYREALFPWMSAWKNIAYPLVRRGMKKAAVQARVQELAEMFDIRFDLQRYPYELSGGQQQTVCIMRALAPGPEVMFLDEPFSALDFEMTLFIRDKLQEVQQATGVTMLIVSHDLEDAVFLADEILLLTRRPTSVAEIVPFTLPRPRGAEAMSDPEFIRVKAHTLAVFKREMAAG